MLGLNIGIGWFGFGPRRDLFTVWFDLGPITLGCTPSVARAQVREIAERAQKIKEAVTDLAKRVRK